MLDPETTAYLAECKARALASFPLSRVTEDFHDRMLEVLPPAHKTGVPGFFVIEAATDDVHAQFVHAKGKFYGAYVELSRPETYISYARIEAFEAATTNAAVLSWYPEEAA